MELLTGMIYFLTLSAGIILIVTSTQVLSSFAQQSVNPMLKPPNIDVKAVLFSVSPLIVVEYQTDTMVVLKADEDSLLLSNGTMTQFWNAVDVVKHYGYSLDDVTTSGMGSQGNPTRFYAIMSKP